MENCWLHILKAVRYAGLKCTAHYREEPDNVSGTFSQSETLTILKDIFWFKVSSTIVAERNSPSFGLHVILMVDISLITLGSEEKHSHWLYWEIEMPHCEERGCNACLAKCSSPIPV